MSTPVRSIKKGDTVFKDGDKITHIILVQSGALTVGINRGKKITEVFHAGPGSILGEQALQGATNHNLTAIVSQEAKVFEVPVEIMKQAVEGSPQMVKAVFKALNDRVKAFTTELRSYKMEKDSSPCPEDQVARTFGTIFHTVNHKGEKDPKAPGKTSLDWSVMRYYTTRVFGDSLKRIEQMINILIKHKMAAFEMGKLPEDPEGPDQILRAHFFDVPFLEAFFEFYQYYFFKPGKSELLKADDTPMQLVAALIKCSDGIEADRKGVTTVLHAKFVEQVKEDIGISLNTDHFARLEQKGVFIKRHVLTDGVPVMQFEMAEIKNLSRVWVMIREIEKLNEKGFVDMNEDYLPKKKVTVAGGSSCPQCATSLPAQAKFCSECGFKMAA